MPAHFTRRAWCLLLVIACLGNYTQQVSAQNVATLYEQLKSVLKARRDVEFVFLARVAELVNQKQLSYDLVIAVMNYAVRKRADIPYPYFEKVITLKAAELGVEI